MNRFSISTRFPTILSTMKHSIMIRTGLFILLSFCTAGCGKQRVSTETTVTTNGGSVSNTNGKGEGTVAGVKITVLGLESHSAGVASGADVAQDNDGTRKSETWYIDFGEVSIGFRREDDEPIALSVNGKDYGSVTEGDELVIDENRVVSVNGKKRDAGNP